MVIETTGESPFTPTRFFERAGLRLAHSPPQTEATEPHGDHALNPGFLIEGATYRDAAVLIPVVAREPEATVILTVRTPHLSAHAGQIAFPGGKIESSDPTPAAAAAREAEEEIGLSARVVTTVGYLEPYLTRTGYRIVPVVGRVEAVHALSLNPAEVEDAFEVPLSFLMTPANHRRGNRVFLGKARTFYEMPYEGRYIWGITAGIIRGLYERMYG